jgi:protein-disulfide isomerase
MHVRYSPKASRSLSLRALGVPLLALLLATLLGCGAASSTATRPDSLEDAVDPFTLVPDDPIALGQLNVARLRDSPYADPVKQWWSFWLDQEQTRKQAQRADPIVRDLLARSDRLVGGIGLQGKTGNSPMPQPEPVLVLQGRWEDLESWVRSLPGGASEQIEVRTEQGHKVLVLDEVVGVAVDSHTWAFTEGEHLDRLLARVNAGKRTVPQDGTLARLAERVKLEDATGAFAFEIFPMLRKKMVGEISSNSKLDRATVAALQGYGVRVEVDEGIRFDQFVRVEDASSAGAVLEEIQAYQDEYGSHPIAVLLGLDLMVQATEMSQEKRAIAIRTRLDDAQTRQIGFHLDRLSRGVAGLFGERGLGRLFGNLAQASSAEGDDKKSVAVEKAPDAEPAQIESSDEVAEESDKPVFRVPVGDAPQRGPDDALVTIVEFGEFQGPYCKRVPPTLDRIREEYGDKVRIVWMNHPLPFHDQAMPAAIAAWEVYKQGGDEAFWKMHDLLFDNQKDLGRKAFIELAKQAGVDAAGVREALEQGTHRDTIRQQVELAKRLGQRGTPAFFINGRPLSGAKPFSRFKEAIDRELAKARRLLEQGTRRDGLYQRIIEDGRTEAQ